MSTRHLADTPAHAATSPSFPDAPPAGPSGAPWHVAIVGAGPAGLSLALMAASAWPQARITVMDARPADHDFSRDGRTLALSLGTVHSLMQMGVWPDVAPMAEPITEVHVSQQQPTLGWPGDQQPAVTITARDMGQPQLGAVVNYGALVEPLQAHWLAQVASSPVLADGLPRLAMRFDTRVQALTAQPTGGATLQTQQGAKVSAPAGAATPPTSPGDHVDLIVVAEGGVFANQPKLKWPQGLSRDYGQSAWVGQVALSDAAPRGVAFERFTPAGPVALLPLPDGPLGAPHASGPSVRRAALVWCVQQGDDPVAALDDAQRLTLLNTQFHDRVGGVTGISHLKCFPLGLNVHSRLVDDGAVVRIGNAAQTLHPVAGQGFNLGMRDVQVLLQAVQDAGVARLKGAERQRMQAAALKQFERRRQPDRVLLVGATDFLAQSFTWPAPALATLRGWGLGLVQAAGPARQLLARAMMFGRR
jgi:2-octaprenyl-6-methoxyphenol hydroxylase